jgi:ubiquitin carboxyl-terminal hydrolase 8
MAGGLANAGNTCSINSLLQCLGHCTRLLELVLETEMSHRKIKDRQFSVFQELKIIFYQLWKENQNLIPIRFLKAFYESLGEFYQPGEQFDFTEMWFLTLNTLIKETHTPDYKSEAFPKRIFQDPVYKSLQKQAVGEWVELTKLNNSPITDLFYGMQVNQIKCCHCDKIFHNFEPFSCSYFEVAGMENLSQAIDQFYRPETLQDWTCDHCQHKQAEKMNRFWKLPNVWVIVLKRFNQDQKLQDPITLYPEFSLNTLQGDSYKYRLKAIANHFGSLQSGHYNAFCREGKTWSLYDDKDIHSPINPEDIFVNNKSGYVLFYEKVY